MKKALPIGISDFEIVITEGYYYIDKSLFIEELLDSKAAVTLIPRPRRFGKTLNLSMLKCFFEKTEESKQSLFKDLKIAKEIKCMKYQGKSPVIFMTFKDVKNLDWNDCYKKMRKVISREYCRHDYLILGDILSEKQKNIFQSIVDEKADQSNLESALENLSCYLHRYYKKKPIILIDEYDAPIHAGFANNYYNEVVNFMRIFLSAGIKDNSDLKFCVMTGILRVAKESIFSGLNNLEVCSILSDFYADKFGLIESEVIKVLSDYSLDEKEIDKIKAWYNGYRFGDQTVYNPWSIINLIKSNVKFQPYWINTSSNDIIKDLIANGSDELKEDFEQLLLDKTIDKPIYENIIFAEVSLNTNYLWSFLFFSGYLTCDKVELRERTTYASLKIPNNEVRYFYETTIKNWFISSFGDRKYNLMLKCLVSGDISEFKKIFTSFVIKSLSFFDVSGDEPEKFYHAFVLGILVNLQNTHQIKSNRESGFGRYDVMIIPKDKKQPGVIIEFKKIDTYEKEVLEDAANIALAQIENKQYEQELLDLGINKIIKLAIVFKGKHVLVKGQND